MTTPHQDIPALRAGLADQLAAELPSRTWPEVFRVVDRHVFAPRFALFDPVTGSFTHYDVHDPDPVRRAEAMAAAYSNDTLITRFDDDGNPISSSTEPSMMASMLAALDLRPGHRVLEVGTGTGYNAALLARFVGDEQVTTIDVDGELINTARAALDVTGYAPTVVCGDGAAGVPERAPFDRIMATCGVDRVPGAWLDQLTADGAILVTVSTGIALLRRAPDGAVHGRFLGAAGFMPLRSHGYQPRWSGRRVLEETGGSADDTRSVTVPKGLELSTAAFFTSLIAEHGRLVFLGEDEQVVSYRWVHPASGSWVRVDLGEHPATVHQAGSRRLWDEVEPVLETWDVAGRPEIDRYGLTVTTDGRHVLWLDSPEHHITAL